MVEPRFPNTKRPAFPKEVHDAVFARDGAACVYCGSTTALELDHVYPWAQGGSSEPSNLVVACRVDNLLASDRVFPEFVVKRDWVQRARQAVGPRGLAYLARVAALIDVGDLEAVGRMSQGLKQ